MNAPLVLLLVCGWSSSSELSVRPPAEVRCIETDDTITVSVGDKTVLTYNKSVQESPQGIDPEYRRSGYIHPVYSPAGRQVTGDFALDHPHQHAVFFPWTEARFENRDVNFWDQKQGTGRISHAMVVSVESGDECGQFTVELLHEDLSAPEGAKPVLRELWTVRVFNRSDDYFVFDVTSEQHCASDSPLILNEYHYGGMAIRGCDDWFDESSAAAFAAWERKRRTEPDLPPPAIDVMRHEFVTSEGHRRHDGNHSRPRWVDMYGLIEGHTAGVAVLGHPGNFRAPQPVRLHPNKPYFCFAPMVLGEFQITPQAPYVSRYRFMVHDGPPNVDEIEAEWQRFTR